MRMLINSWLQKRDVITCFFNGFEKLKIKVTESGLLICMEALRNHYSEKSDKSLTVTKLQVWNERFRLDVIPFKHRQLAQ